VVALVQSAVPATQAATSVNRAFPSNVTAGSLLLACLYVRDTTVGVLSDTQGNTWLTAGNPHPNNLADNTRQCVLGYVENAKAGATTVTGTSAGGTALVDMMIAEFSGFTTLAQLETVAYSFANTTSFSSLTIPTARSAGGLIFSAACTRDILTAGASGDGFTILQDGTGFDSNSSKYKIATAVGQQAAATYTSSGTVGNWVVIASFADLISPFTPHRMPLGA
jgi:hypothetical protein